MATAATALAVIAPYTKKNIFSSIKANNLEIKNGFVVSKLDGKKYTGTLKYNSRVFGLEKETVTFAEGKPTEVLHHSFTGKELNAIFLKNGKRRIQVGNITRNQKQQLYPKIEFDNDGNPIRTLDCFAKPEESIFDKVREFLKTQS